MVPHHPQQILVHQGQPNRKDATKAEAELIADNCSSMTTPRSSAHTEIKYSQKRHYPLWTQNASVTWEYYIWRFWKKI